MEISENYFCQCRRPSLNDASPDSIDMISSVDEEFGMVDLHMMEFDNIGCMVCLECDSLSNAGPERLFSTP